MIIVAKLRKAAKEMPAYKLRSSKNVKIDRLVLLKSYEFFWIFTRLTINYKHTVHQSYKTNTEIA